jgi:hypothetical protein
MATRLAIGVEDTELQGIVRDERQRVEERWAEPRAARPRPPAKERRSRPDRSRDPER